MSARQNGLGWLWPVLGAAAIAAPSASLAQPVERFSVAGARVAIYNLAGEVQVRGGDGDAVAVELRRGGTDAERLVVARGPIDGFETLRIVYPGDRVVYTRAGTRSRSELRVREDGTFYDDGRNRGRKVTVVSDGRGLVAHADLTVTVPPGRSVALYLAVGRVTVSNVEGDLLVDVGSADVSASGTKGTLSIDTGSGDVSVSEAEGDVRADTGSGEVELRGIRGRQLIADTGSGSVIGSGIAVSEVLVDTGSGAVDLSSLSASDVRVDTGSGSVRLGLLTDVNWLEVDTGSGGVDVSVPDGFGAGIEIETGSGGIDTDLPLEVTRVERSYLQGRIGDGQGRVMIGTGSGSVTLRRG